MEQSYLISSPFAIYGPTITVTQLSYLSTWAFPKNNDTNKRLIIVNDKKGCTQTAYVGSLVTMLVLHAEIMFKT